MVGTFWLAVPCLLLDVAGFTSVDTAVVSAAADRLESTGFPGGSVCGLAMGEMLVPAVVFVTGLLDTVLGWAALVLTRTLGTSVARTINSSSGGSRPEESTSSPCMSRSWVTRTGGLVVLFSFLSDTAFFLAFSKSAAQRSGSILRAEGGNCFLRSLKRRFVESPRPRCTGSW